MAEKSVLWSTSGTGDGAANYTQTELFSWQSRGHLVDQTAQGVIAGYLNSLKASTSATASPVTIDTGAAYVYGIPYINDAIKSFTVPTPVTGTTGYRIVLRADYTAQTVRLVLKGAADGTATPPAVTQTAGTTWEISLYTFTITTAGAIANWTDTRGLIYPDGFLQFLQATAFGSSTAAPFPKVAAPMLVQMGQVTINPSPGTATITFPQAFSQTPYVFVSIGIGVGSGTTAGAFSISSTGFSINIGGGLTTPVNWLAIGPV